ncbi:hypothetical protein RCL1_005244 [Eukaryota sp. TZLM3-RCL]
MSTDTQSLRASAWNVDSYHWETREWSPWAHTRIKELLNSINIPVTETNGQLSLTSVSSISGDASTALRKGKIRYFFELEFRVGLKYEVEDSEKGTLSCSGEYSCKIAGDEDPSEWEFTFKPIGKSALTKTLKELSPNAIPIIKEHIAIFVDELSKK